MNLGALIAILSIVVLFIGFCIADYISGRKPKPSAPCPRDTCENADDVTCEECEARHG